MDGSFLFPDASSPPDAAPTTIAVTVTQAGVPVSAATVLADSASGTQTQATTGDTGAATISVSGISDVTIVVQLTGLAEIVTMTGVQPGEAVTFALPDADPQTITFDVGGTSPDSSTAFDLWVPSPSNNLSDHQFPMAGNGMPSVITVPANAVTTPIDLVAISGDGTEYSGVPARTYSAGDAVTLTMDWMPVSTFMFAATGMPDEVTSVSGNMSMLSDGFGLSGGSTSMELADGSASGSMTFAPFGEVYRSNMQVGTAIQSQALNHASADEFDSYTVTGDSLLPWITNVAMAGTPLAMTWSTTASGGSLTPQGYVIEMQYTTTAGSAFWIATRAPDATSWTLPTLPSSLSMWSPVGATNVSGFPISLYSSAITGGYNAFRTLVCADLDLLNGHGNALELGDTVSSFPFNNQ